MVFDLKKIYKRQEKMNFFSFHQLFYFPKSKFGPLTKRQPHSPDANCLITVLKSIQHESHKELRNEVWFGNPAQLITEIWARNNPILGMPHHPSMLLSSLTNIERNINFIWPSLNCLIKIQPEQIHITKTGTQVNVTNWFLSPGNNARYKNNG